MADNSIARVYQFLSNNYSSIEEWKKEVDERYGNDDGTMIKSEYNSFMLREFDFDVDENPNDIINKFWASIDSKTVGKVGSTGICNVNALDESELKLAQVLLEISNQINTFMQDKPGEDLGISDINGWKNSVKEGMLNKIATKLQGTNATVDSLDIQHEMEKAYQQTVRKATADYVKNDIISKEIKNNADFSGITYYPDDDKELTKIVNRYIKSLDGDESTSLKDIVSDVESLIKAYADTAKTNSQSSIDKLGSAYNANGKLNDLQMAVLVKSITDGITKKLESDSQYKALNEAYGDVIVSKVQPYAENALKGKKASEFNSIKNDLSKYIDGFFTSEIADIEKEYNDTQTAKSELKSYLSDKYTDKYKAAIKEVFGSDTKSEVEKAIDGLKTLSDVQAKADAIKAKIAAEDAKLPSSFLDALTNLTVGIGQTKTIELPNNYGIYTTGHLHYSATGDSAVRVADSTGGKIVISSSSEGVYKATVTVTNDEGQVLATKEVTVTVSKDFSMVGDLSGVTFAQTIAKTGTERGNNLKVQTVDLDEAYKNNYILELSSFEGNWETCKTRTKARMDELLTAIKNGFASKGYNTAALETAYTKTKSLYDAILEGQGGRAGKKSNETKSYAYDGETYTYYSKYWYREATAGREFSNAKSSGGVINDTGIQWNYSYAGDDTDEFYVNIRNVIDIFMKFYKKAISG